VLETEKRREEKKCKRLGLVQPKSSSAWHTGLSGGAPDSVQCARPASGEQATLGKNRRRMTIIHRIVRWCTRLSGEPTAASATVGRAIHGRRVARANGRQGAPDYSVRQLVRRCNSHLRQKRKEIRTRPSTCDCPVVHRTVRCTTRQKATLAFLVGLQRLLAALGLQKGHLGAWRSYPSLQETF
jgi:hypothetical protein